MYRKIYNNNGDISARLQCGITCDSNINKGPGAENVGASTSNEGTEPILQVGDIFVESQKLCVVQQVTRAERWLSSMSD